MTLIPAKLSDIEGLEVKDCVIWSEADYPTLEECLRLGCMPKIAKRYGSNGGAYYIHHEQVAVIPGIARLSDWDLLRQWLHSHHELLRNLTRKEVMSLR